MTSEHDYEEWYQKYLGDIESVLDYEPERSPYTNTPKPFSQRKMLIWCTVLFFFLFWVLFSVLCLMNLFTIGFSAGSVIFF